jgi:3-oxoacyl-[acyl-carrier protein] reductase
MDLGLTGRTAIVCGASSGIGLAIAEALAAEGANVAMFARRRDVLEREAERLGALAVRGDVAVPADLERLVERTVAAFGGVDIVINNSGGPAPGPAAGVTEEQIEGAIALLLHSAVRLTNLCLPLLEQSGRGRIVNIESAAVREPIDNLVLSNMTRAAVVAWAKTLSREVGPKGITVNTIATGKIETDRLRSLYSAEQFAKLGQDIPARRPGRPSELADLVCFLASDRASYISGTVIPVDGGLGRGLL